MRYREYQKMIGQPYVSIESKVAHKYFIEKEIFSKKGKRGINFAEYIG